MSRLFAVTLAGAIFCLASAGCGESGPELGKVSGTVTMDGNPMPNVLVTFSPTEQKLEGSGSSTGTTDASGKYTLIHSTGHEGAVPGSHKVTVTSLAPSVEASAAAATSSDSAAYEQQATSGSVAEYASAAQKKEAIPAAYNTNSKLVEEVKAGDNVIDLKLTSSGQ